MGTTISGDHRVTALLPRLREGDRAALDEVVSALYAELRRIASGRLRGEWGTRLLMTTELVHETYLRLSGQRRLAAEDRAAFFAVAANTMRRILVDAARTRQRRKRGGDPFREIQLPAAAMALKQGAGRLIRSEADRGLLVVCDERLLTRGYGRSLVSSLPPFGIIRDLDEAIEWLVREPALLSAWDDGADAPT